MISREHPDYLLCPVTTEIFFHPVTLSSGILTEQKTADDIIDHGDGLCPITREKITHYVRAYNILEAVNAYLEEHEEAKEDQHESYEITLKRTVDQTIAPIVTSPSVDPILSSCSVHAAPIAFMPSITSEASVSTEEKLAQEAADEAFAKQLLDEEREEHRVVRNRAASLDSPDRAVEQHHWIAQIELWSRLCLWLRCFVNLEKPIKRDWDRHHRKRLSHLTQQIQRQ